MGGGGRDTITLFAYSQTIITTTVLPGHFWTTFGTTSAKDASRITGKFLHEIKYRAAVKVNRQVLDKYFTNVATKMVPGLPSSDEYKNKLPIPANYLESITL